MDGRETRLSKLTKLAPFPPKKSDAVFFGFKISFCIWVFWFGSEAPNKSSTGWLAGVAAACWVEEGAKGAPNKSGTAPTFCAGGAGVVILAEDCGVAATGWGLVGGWKESSNACQAPPPPPLCVGGDDVVDGVSHGLWAAAGLDCCTGCCEPWTNNLFLCRRPA